MHLIPPFISMNSFKQFDLSVQIPFSFFLTVYFFFLFLLYFCLLLFSLPFVFLITSFLSLPSDFYLLFLVPSSYRYR